MRSCSMAAARNVSAAASATAPAFALQARGELRDCRRLAAAVHANEEEHARGRTELEGPRRDDGQPIADLLSERRSRGLAVARARSAVASPRRIDELDRCTGPHVAGDEHLLDLVPGRFARWPRAAEEAAETGPDARWPCAQPEAAHPGRRPRRPRDGSGGRVVGALIGRFGCPGPLAAAAEHQTLASTGRSARRSETTRETAASVMVTP